MFRLSIGMAFIAVLFPVMANAMAPADTPRTITLRDAINNSLQHHPHLASFQLRTRALAGEKETADLKPALQVSTEIENVLGSDTYRNADNAELSLSLSSSIESRDQRDARGALVTARQQQVFTEERLFALNLSTDVAHAFFALLAAQEILGVQQQTFLFAQEAVPVLTRHVQAGRSPAAELLRARASLGRADIGKVNAEKDLTLARMTLSNFWGETEQYPFVARGDLYSIGNPESLKKIMHFLDSHPELALLTQEARVREAELRLAQKASQTPIEWSAGVRHFRDTDDSAMVLGFSVPLGSRTRSSGAIKTALAQKNITEQARDAALINLRTQLKKLYEEQKNLVYQATTLRDQVVPLLRQAAQETQDAFGRGRYSYMEWSTAQSELLEAEIALIQAATKAHQLRAEIERLDNASNTTADYQNAPSAQKPQGVSP